MRWERVRNGWREGKARRGGGEGVKEGIRVDLSREPMRQHQLKQSSLREAGDQEHGRKERERAGKSRGNVIPAGRTQPRCPRGSGKPGERLWARDGGLGGGETASKGKRREVDGILGGNSSL